MTQSVCHLLSTYHPVVGGAQRATRMLCCSLAARGAQVDVLTRRPEELARRAVDDGVNVHRLGSLSLGKVGSAAFVAESLWRLATELRSRGPVHVHNLDAPVLVGLLAKLILGRTLIVTLHGEVGALESRGLWGRLKVHTVCRLADAFVVLTEHLRDRLGAEGVSDDRIQLIPNGMEIDRVRPASASARREARAALGLPPDEVSVLFLGRLIALKQVDRLLHAWKRLSSEAGRHLVIVGDGPERARLESLAGRLNLAGARFEGERIDILPYLQAADVLVLPSRSEGLSVALLEAMASGLAVVVSDLPANRELIRDGTNGFLVPVGDVDALANTLERVLSDQQLRRQMGGRARATVVERFSLHAVAAAHERLYDQLAKGATASMSGGAKSAEVAS